MKTKIEGRLVNQPKLSQKVGVPNSQPEATFKLVETKDYLDRPDHQRKFGEGASKLYSVTVTGVHAKAAQEHLHRGFLVSVTGELNEDTNELIGSDMTILSNDAAGVDVRG